MPSLVKKTTTAGLSISIRPETPDEYWEVNDIIYKAFTASHGIDTGTFMMEHIIDEQKKNTFILEHSRRVCHSADTKYSYLSILCTNNHLPIRPSPLYIPLNCAKLAPFMQMRNREGDPNETVYRYRQCV